MVRIPKRKIAAVVFWLGLLGIIGVGADPETGIGTDPIAFLLGLLMMFPYLCIAFREGYAEAGTASS